MSQPLNHPGFRKFHSADILNHWNCLKSVYNCCNLDIHLSIYKKSVGFDFSLPDELMFCDGSQASDLGGPHSWRGSSRLLQGLLLRCSENEGELERDMSCLSRARGARRVELSTGRSMPMKTY